MKMVVWFGFVLFGGLCAAVVIVTKPGLSITLECGAKTYKTSLEWKHGNDLILLKGGRGFPRKGTTDTAARSNVRNINLMINNVQEKDSGKFTCKADGVSYDHTLLVVSISAKSSRNFQLGSEVTLQCQVKGLNQDSTVQWTRPDGSLHTGSQTFQLKSMSDSGTWKCKFSHEGGMHSEDLAINVTEPKPTTPAPDPSHDSKDSRKPTCVNCDTKRPSNPPIDAGLLLGLSWWMWVIIGVGCLVVVLLTILVICLCKRVRRRRRKLQKMQSSRQLPKQYCQCNRPTAAAKPQQRRRREKPSALPLQPLLLE